MLGDQLSGQGLLIDAAALAAVSLVGYLFGRRPRRDAAPPDPQMQEELARAQRVADDLKRVTQGLSIELATHGRSVASFQSQLAAMQTGAAEADWRQLRERAELLLSPTLELATSLTLAVGQLKRHHGQLAAFSGSRFDAETGLHNRRSLAEQLDAFFSIHAAGKRRFALALFSVCPVDPRAEETGQGRLRQVASLVSECIRDDDFAARYSQDEFVVLMPQTPIAGGLAFGERLLMRATRELDCPMWGGVVEATGDDSPDRLLSRADSALYSARATGESSLFIHSGTSVRRHVVDVAPPSVDACGDELVSVGESGWTR